MQRPSSLADYLNLSADIVKAAATHVSSEAMDSAVELCVEALKNNKPILVCGNGGSSADAMHIEAELVGRFLKERKGFYCLSLTSNPAMLTSCANDYGYETVFSRQVEAFGCEGAVLIGISTSGNSRNVVLACEKAKALGMNIIGYTGEGGARMAEVCDVLLDAPSRHTPLIQQVHICLYHYMCEKIEEKMAALTEAG
ncbi:MAG: SIS domain-containing protein [Bdellovibrionales bacterium]